MRHLAGWVLGGAEPVAAGGGFYLIRQAGACHLSCFASVSLIIVVQLRLSLVGLCDSARFRFAVSVVLPLSRTIVIASIVQSKEMV